MIDHTQVRSVFGRDEDVERVVGMLASSPGVVTITGRGGIGKTSVALEVLGALGPESGIWVPLAGVTDPELVLPEIANALGAPIPSGKDVTDVVAGLLGQDSRVLVLDNAEHLLAIAPTLGVLLDRCPNLRVLVTSQAPLRLRAERVVDLAPLPDPSDPAETTLEELGEQPAVAAYCRRAAAVAPSFDLTEQNAGPIVELCRRLEGLPLAIELAAARAAFLPPSEILRHLEDAGLDLLRRPRGDAPRRHHGLRAAIEWTYGLLAPDEQQALRSLSAIVGTFDLDTALAIIDPTSGADPDAVLGLDALSALVDFHLVDPVRGSDPARFAIPDSIRSVAGDELERCGEASTVQRRRIQVRARQARITAEGSETCRTEGRVGSMETDRDDLLDALRAAIDLGVADDALDIARGLGAYWDVSGYGSIQETLIERALELGERADADPSRLANATLWSAFLGLRHSSAVDHDELVARIRRAEELARRAEDDQAAFHAQNVWLLVTPTTGGIEQAHAAVEEGMRLAQRNDHEGWRATIQVWAGMIAHLEGDERRAAELGTAALESARRRGDQETVVRAFMLLGPMADRFPDLAGLPTVEEMIELTQTLGLTFYESILLVRRVNEAVRAGDLDAAVRWMTETLGISRRLLDSPVVCFDLHVLVLLAHARGDLDRAAFFSGSLRDSLPLVEPYIPEPQLVRYNEILDGVREALGAAAFDQHAARGAALDWYSALDEAARYLDGVSEASTVDLSEPSSLEEPQLVARLTTRQVEVLRLLAAGMSNKEIATELGVRAKTVMHHTVAIYRELGVRGRSEATAVAFRSGIAV